MSRRSIWTGLNGPPRSMSRAVKDDQARDASHRAALASGNGNSAARAKVKARVSLRRFTWEEDRFE